jgi:GAF domain-containing protein
MEEINISSTASKAEKYEQLIPQIEALVGNEKDLTANLANVAAALHHTFNFWWTGFYLVKNDQLVLAPFQGPVACTRIAFGKGVCGTAWETQQTLVVPDVEQFQGHIACSSETKSEIVVPILKNNQVAAVLDIDSENLSNFDDVDKTYLEQIALFVGKKFI